MKRFLIVLLTFSIFLTGCSGGSDKRIIKKLEKTLDKYIGYESTIEIKILMNEKESNYKMKEEYIKNGVYRIEILEPKASKGITIEYEDEKVYINNASIKQSISLKSIKDLNKGLLIGEFFDDLGSIESIREENIDKESYYIFNNNVKEKNKFNNSQEIWVKKKDFTPYVMNILDEEGNIKTIIKYKKFKFIKNKDK